MLTTGVGSLPGTSPREAARLVAGEFDLPFLAELPGRGPGADMLGRTLGALRSATGEFAAETTPTGWRLAAGRAGAEPGRALRRAESWLNEDLDALEEALQGYSGPLKLAFTGPWTLAAGVEGSSGHRLLRDPGACADVAAALAETCVQRAAELRRRVAGLTELWLQLDEPSLPAVMGGRIPTASGRGSLRTPELSELVAGLERVISGLGSAGLDARGLDGTGLDGTGLATRALVHCCAAPVPYAVFAKAGFGGVSVDLTTAGQHQDEDLAAWWEAGRTVVAGVLPAVGGAAPSTDRAAALVAGVWSRMGLHVAQYGPATLLSPACGMAGSAPGDPLRAAQVLRQAARQLESAD